MNLFLRKCVAVLFVLLTCSVFPCRCLYEDQIGKFDWRQQFVGQLLDVAVPIKTMPSHSHNSVVLATESNAIAALFVRNGSIEWRHHLEAPIDTLSAGDGVKGCDVVSVNGRGKWIRCWSKEGHLISETSLPRDLLEELEKEKDVSIKFFLNVSKDSKEVLICKIFWAEKRLEILKYGIQSMILGRSPSIAAPWLKESTSCDFVSSRYLICLDSVDLSIHFLVIENYTLFKTIPLTSFGLETSTKPTSLKIQKFPYQDISPNPCFAIDLDGNGFVFLRIQQEEVKLVKVLPNVSGMTITPSEEVNKFIVYLMVKTSQAIPGDDFGTDNFKLVAYDLNNWNEISSLSGQFNVHRQISINKMFIIPFVRNDLKFFYRFFLSTEDGLLVMANLQGKVMWKREEALASIVTAEILDLPLSELDARIEQTFSISQTNILNNFMNRLTTQVYQLQTFLLKTIPLLISNFKQKIGQSSVQSEDEFGDGNSQILPDTTLNLVRDKFGLHKIVVAWSKVGKLFGIDSISGQVVWSLFDKKLRIEEESPKKIFVQRTTSYYPHSAWCTIVLKNGFIFSFDPITGNILDKQQIDFKVMQTMMMSHANEVHLKPIIIVNSELEPVIYPESTSFFLKLKDSYFMMIADKSSGSLTGLAFDESTQEKLLSRKVWNLQLPVPLNDLQVFFKKYNERVHSQGRVMGDRNVLYKYLNPNLVAVVSESTDSQDKILTVYLIDAITGAIIFSTAHKRSKGPVHLVHSENWIIYSFYNEKSRRTEISSIELYEGTTQGNTTAFSSLTRVELSPAIVEHQTFIFPTGIDVMADTITERGITSKHILIVLPSGGLLELPKAFLDPRRPINPTPEHREEGLIPYIPELPILSEGIINYNKSLTAIKGIQTAATNLESTCLVFAFGLDLFYTRVTPSKTFDILKDDFDFLLISAVLICIIVFSYLTKWLAAKKSLKSVWK